MPYNITYVNSAGKEESHAEGASEQQLFEHFQRAVQLLKFNPPGCKIIISYEEPNTEYDRRLLSDWQESIRERTKGLVQKQD